MAPPGGMSLASRNRNHVAPACAATSIALPSCTTALFDSNPCVQRFIRKVAESAPEEHGIAIPTLAIAALTAPTHVSVSSSAWFAEVMRSFTGRLHFARAIASCEGLRTCRSSDGSAGAIVAQNSSDGRWTFGLVIFESLATAGRRVPLGRATTRAWLNRLASYAAARVSARGEWSSPSACGWSPSRGAVKGSWNCSTWSMRPANKSAMVARAA